MRADAGRYFRRGSLRLAAAGTGVIVCIASQPTAGLADRAVNITAVSANHSSVTIDFDAVPGARDYRAYDVANPNDVKYAGLVPDAGSSPKPATVIEWNAAGDGVPHVLMVEALDALGPVSLDSLYNPDTNAPLVAAPSPGAMLGSNKGRTLDGKISTNGQGPYDSNPHVLARSDPFVVQASHASALPSGPLASSVFLDTFENREASTIVKVSENRDTGAARYSVNAGTPLSASIQFQEADVLNSMPFIAGDHFMDVLFDGGTPGTNAPLHQGHGVMAMSPDMTAAWGPEQLLHVTEEVDAHTDSRRWMDILITPADDPAVAFDEDHQAVNGSNRGVRLQVINDGECTLDIYTGPAGGMQAPSGTAGGSHGSRLWGAAGQAPVACDGLPSQQSAFDLRSRIDLFLSQTHAALFVNGQLVQQSDIAAAAFPWANQPVRIYFTHYVYHSENDITELRAYACGPMHAFWFNDPIRGTRASDNACGVSYPPGYGFPRSDERHWDNLGFEVLPAAAAPNGDFRVLSVFAPRPARRPLRRR